MEQFFEYIEKALYWLGILVLAYWLISTSISDKRKHFAKQFQHLHNGIKDTIKDVKTNKQQKEGKK